MKFLGNPKLRFLIGIAMILGCLRGIEAGAQTVTLHFDELATQPVNGLTYQGVTFSFTVNGSASADATYNSSNGPGNGTYVQTPDLEGDANGTLALDFAAPTPYLQFGIALSVFSTLAPGFTVQLFDASLKLIGTVPVNTMAINTIFSEGQFSQTSGTPVKRAVITFNNPGSRFALDNLTYVPGSACVSFIAPPSASSPAAGGSGSFGVNAPANCSWTVASNAGFLTVTSGATGSGSATVSYSVAGNNTPSVRSGTITVGSFTHTVNQAAGSAMSVGPLTMDFTGSAGSATQTMPLNITSSSGTVNWTATALSGSGWLNISPSGGSANPNAPSTLNVSVNFGSLTPNLYEGTVTVKDNGSGLTNVVQIRASVGTGQSRIVITQSTFVFNAAQNGTQPASQSLGIFNAGAGNMQWSIAAGSLPPWLSVSPSAGVSQAGGESLTTLTADATGQAPGVYQTLVPATASGAANNPQLVTVTLLVVAPGTAPSALMSPRGMAFAAVQGGAAPLPQTVTFSNGGAGGVNFTLAVATTNGGPWLHISQGSGSTSLGPAPIQVTVDPSGLSAGIYRGTITATFSAGGAQAVDVLFVVAPFGTVLQREEPGAGTGCSPTAMDMVVSTVGSGLSLPVSFPQTLLAQVLDNCGGNVTNATVVGNLGTLNVVMQGVGGGLYSATWTPDTAGSVAALFTATHAVLGTVQRSFNLTAGAAPVVLPTILPNGVVEGAGFTALRPLAPGSIVSIFGTAFAAGDNFAAQVPLPPTLGGVGVKIGSADAPLYYAGTGQINAQMPLTAKPGESVSIAVTANGKVTAPQSYLIAPNQPGIFNGAVLDFQNNPGAGGQPVTAASPARIGHDLIIYSGGLGLTDASVQTGAASPAGNALLPVTVMIGGVPIIPDYAGLSPGFVGLYQVNVHLGANIPAGDNLDVVLTQNGIASNPNLPIRISIR